MGLLRLVVVALLQHLEVIRYSALLHLQVVGVEEIIIMPEHRLVVQAAAVLAIPIQVGPGGIARQREAGQAHKGRVEAVVGVLQTLVVVAGQEIRVRAKVQALQEMVAAAGIQI